MSTSSSIFNHHWVDLVYKMHNENIYYHSIDKDEFADAINHIYNNNYKLSPLLRIYFQPGSIVGSDLCYKGVPVLPISEKPPVDLGIEFELTTYYMKPVDELVLSALGKLLLQIHYPYYLDDRDHVASINETLFNVSREMGAKGISALVYIETCCNDLIRTLSYHFLLAPFLYYMDSDSKLMPRIHGEKTHNYLDTDLPVHYFGPFYKVPFFYDYLALISHKIDA